MAFKVRKSNEITHMDIGFVNLSVILQKTLRICVMSPEIIPGLLFICLPLHGMLVGNE